MKALHLIFGSRNEFLLIILLSFSSYSIAQTKTYSKINIDTLQVKDLRMQDGKIEDIFIKNTDVASANEEFNNLVKECLIISDHQILNLLSREENWQGSIFKSTIPSNIKVGQYSIDQSNRYLYVYDGIKLIRIPILTDYIDNIEAIYFNQLFQIPKNYQKGTMYFDGKINRLKYFNGKKWIKI